ncbi:hypothetical protein DYB25_002791 [Aphanomyces astaci]|uniref:WRKY19-like zinc finger domain-containing protein n=1 Tax=Aphanomyces astaci TaxID=112090 RepID=A0A397BSZ5_APHAT|nr:hypothetical protein DYB36_009306 [Aphanomyces astaci]RHY25894.1 hypothetical protein DYB25_002791 [Aphanomyces astaci]RHY37049.1 hypothetical protein DYB34_014115 [Aphanomyces astaci]RHY56176.1 hypothetical protein DYB38_003459 [Aphanomyces astaci]RHY93661.1 hypothetical protein DYB26_002823 [Aphanomyces astaci]
MTTQDCVKVEPMPHKHEESPPFVHIEGLQFFDASLLEPIPFVQAATTCTSSSFAAETGEYAFEALTLECAQDFLFDAMHHDLTFPATCAASSSPSPPRVQPCNDDDDVDIPTTEFPGKCFSEGCSKSISYRGFCKDHGGVRLCSVVGCPKGNQGKRLCISHGGGKRCRISDCEKSAQSHGLCKAHGGGARCTIANCDKSSQGGGRCRKHGGGRRCSVADCSSGAQRANLCAKHGGSRLCGVPECGRTDRGGGLCENHRKDLVCKEGTCNRLAISESTDGLCLRHMRRQK